VNVAIDSGSWDLLAANHNKFCPKISVAKLSLFVAIIPVDFDSDSIPSCDYKSPATIAMRAAHVGEGARVSSSAEPGSPVVRGASPRRAGQVRGFGRAGFRPESRIGRTFRHGASSRREPHRLCPESIVDV
jgi:hypothetical protein